MFYQAKPAGVLNKPKMQEKWLVFSSAQWITTAPSPQGHTTITFLGNGKQPWEGQKNETQLRRQKKKSRDRGASSLFAQFDPNCVLTLSSQEWIWGKISYHRALASCMARSCTTSISLNGQLLPTAYVQFLALIWPSSLKIKLNINIDIHTTVSRQEGIFS